MVGVFGVNDVVAEGAVGEKTGVQGVGAAIGPIAIHAVFVIVAGKNEVGIFVADALAAEFAVFVLGVV